MPAYLRKPLAPLLLCLLTDNPPTSATQLRRAAPCHIRTSPVIPVHPIRRRNQVHLDIVVDAVHAAASAVPIIV